MVSWIHDNGSTYDIAYSTQAGEAESGLRAQNVTSPHVLTGLQSGSHYYVVLFAINNDGQTPSEETSILLVEPPQAPSDLTATPGDQSITLSWGASPTATGYSLYYAQQSGFTLASATKIPEASSPHEHIGLTNDVTLYYVVTAIDEVGESAPSNEVAATPQGSLGDPLLANQWHLAAGPFGVDAESVWTGSQPALGAGVRIAIVDDGLEIAHEDLQANVVLGGSYDYVDGDTDPTGGEHGTAVAGVAASVGGNGLGGSGAAPAAELVGRNPLAVQLASAFADALARDMATTSVSNNSWGPVYTGNFNGMTFAEWQALDNGLSFGRNGLGTAYIFAAGNDGHLGGHTGLSMYTSHRGAIAVGAINDQGTKAGYSTPGSALLVCAPSGDTEQNVAITTTDRTGSLGYNPPQEGNDCYADLAYTCKFSGTSSAAPLVAGVTALVLEANPALTWRDVREVLALSAERNDVGSLGWAVNGAGHWVHHSYGHGKVNAQAAVGLARTWTNLGPEIWVTSATSSPNVLIPDADSNGVSDSIQVSGSGITRLEHLRVAVTAADHSYPGDLEICITSPAGTQSVLVTPHVIETYPFYVPLSEWEFTTTHVLHEPFDGTWTLEIRDLANDDVGHLQTWHIIGMGT